jgi:hypothetical protein
MGPSKSWTSEYAKVVRGVEIAMRLFSEAAQAGRTLAAYVPAAVAVVAFRKVLRSTP